MKQVQGDQSNCSDCFASLAMTRQGGPRFRRGDASSFSSRAVFFSFAPRPPASRRDEDLLVLIMARPPPSRRGEDPLVFMMTRASPSCHGEAFFFSSWRGLLFLVIARHEVPKQSRVLVEMPSAYRAQPTRFSLDKQRENKSSSPLGEKIEVRERFQKNTLTPALSRPGGRGRCLSFRF